MYYISEKNIEKAFLNIRGNIENKFFGLLGILKCIDTMVVNTNTTYQFVDGELSKFLDDVFYLSVFNGRYGETDMYVKFSSKWENYVSHKFFKKTVNLYDVIAFVYKGKAFAQRPTSNQLKAVFCQEFHLTSETIDLWFDTNDYSINYVETPYNADTFKISVGVSGLTLSMDKPYSVAARAGELSRAPFLQTLYAGMDSIKCMLILKQNIDEYYPKSNKNMRNLKKSLLSFPFQQIYYGAPGTGKSHKINDITKIYSTIRTTFHPDSDYSTFVGAYKPVMQKVDLRDLSGHIVEGVQEDRIVYTYVKQAFLKAYLGAWQKYAKAGEMTEPQFLVIEEINRGNCAQIFGDLFQLLDRSDKGFSTYPIEADSDLQNEVKKAFVEGGEYALENDLDVDNAVDDYTSNYGKTLSDDIKNGRILLLPNNLYIWATMNTSDQSLFPIDSAFKRRWDWKYVPINTEVKKWAIEVEGQKYSWTSFLNNMNDQIFSVTHSEDKKFGFFFCHADKKSDDTVEEEDVISAEKFVSKVIFFIYNDVFKDYGFDRKIFAGEDGKPIQFHEYYRMDGSVDESKVKRFLENIEVKPFEAEQTEGAQE